MKYYHYTNGEHINEIIKDGFITYSTIGFKGNEKPAVWVSTNQYYEQTATTVLIKKEVLDYADLDDADLEYLDMKGTYERCKGLYRIEINPNLKLLNFEMFKQYSGITEEMAFTLELTGIKKNANPNEWFVSFENIDMDDWISVEKYNMDTDKWKLIWRND